MDARKQEKGKEKKRKGRFKRREKEDERRKDSEDTQDVLLTSCLLLMACTTSDASVCHSLMSSSLLPTSNDGTGGEEEVFRNNYIRSP